jgi:hypothetical protein
VKRSLLQGVRVRALHRDAARAARKRVVMDTAAQLFAELPAAERKRLAKRPTITALVAKGAGE